MTLRVATVADTSAVAAVYLLSRKTFLSYAPLAHTDAEVVDWLRHILIPTGQVYVMEQATQVIGMMALSPADSVRWIDQLYVHPDWVSQGVGSQFVRFAQTVLSPPIRLYTFQANERSRRFYERHGFRAIAFTDGSDNEECCPDVLYEWNL